MYEHFHLWAYYMSISGILSIISMIWDFSATSLYIWAWCFTQHFTHKWNSISLLFDPINQDQKGTIKQSCVATNGSEQCVQLHITRHKVAHNFERTIHWTEPLSMGHVWKPDCMPDQQDQQKCKPKRKAVAIAAEKSVN